MLYEVSCLVIEKSKKMKEVNLLPEGPQKEFEIKKLKDEFKVKVQEVLDNHK